MQAATSNEPSKDNKSGGLFHQMDSVMRLNKISMDRSMAIKVGLPVMEIAFVIVQYAVIVATADKGKREADIKGIESGEKSNRLGRNNVEMRERRMLVKPDTNISEDVDTFILLHCAATVFAIDTDKAVYKQRPTPI